MASNTPQHIAVIPDGNRRWANKHGLVPWEGHRQGKKRFSEIYCIDCSKYERCLRKVVLRRQIKEYKEGLIK